MKNIDTEIKYLRRHLENALKMPIIQFNQVSDLNKKGIYFVLEKGRIIYVGKTTRTGKKRLSEMAHDFRSHTLHQKLLQKFLYDVLGEDHGRITASLLKSLVAEERATEDQVTNAKLTVRSHIRHKLRFRFYPFEHKRLDCLEHFAISVLNPVFND